MKKLLTFYIVCVVVAQASGQINLDSGLVAHYPFDGNAVDITGKLPDGIVTGAVLTTDRYGNPNCAYYFNGYPDYINLSASDLLKPVAGVSLSLWAHSSSWILYAPYSALAGNSQSGGYDLYVDGSANEIQGYVWANTGYLHPVIPMNTLTDGWHLFILTYDGRYAKIYLDGNLTDTKDAGGNYPISYSYQNSTLVGAEAGYGATPEGDYFQGKIDDIRFYNRALSAEEAMYLFTSSSGIEEKSRGLTIYPNPADEYITVSATNTPELAGDYLMTLTDQTGRIVRKQDLTIPKTTYTEISLSDIIPGLYLMKLANERNNLVFKIIVR